MNPITFPLEPGAHGSAIADLQDALLLLIERHLVVAFPAPNRPTGEELDALALRIKSERLQSAFGDATRQLVRYVQNQQGLGDQLAGLVEEKTADALNRMLATTGVLAPAATFAVAGLVYSANRAGIGGLTVQVVDKNAGPDVVLAQGATDATGRYSLTYSTAPLRKGAPDLQARVSSGGKLLGASVVRYNAGATETLDVLLPAAATAAALSEHAALTGSIAAHYAGRLKDLQESAERTDVTYLANKTGWDARAVALAALADQFSARTAPPGNPAPALAPEFFYALFRAGVPADEDALYRADPSTVQAIWAQAIAHGVIPASLGSAAADAARHFERLGAEKLLTAPALVGVSSLTEMLTASGLTEPQQQQLAALYTAHRADLPAFWQAVHGALGADAAQRLQVDGKLAFLTMNNARLAEAARGAAGNIPLTDPRQLADAGFHRPARWRALLTPDMPIPQEIPGATIDEKRANYADLLAAQIRLSYPTAAVAEMVKAGDLPVDAPNEVHAFLTAHRDFAIGAQPVERFIATNSIQVAAGTTADIKRLQRVYQLTPGDQAMTGLLKRGLDAAYHVVRFDRQTFVQRFADDLGGVDQAARVHQRSQQIHNFTLNIAASYLTAKTGVPLGAAAGPSGVNGGQLLRPGPAGAAAANSGDVLAYPTLETLFGSMDFCACDHCRSLLSPAAYLVDLLQFIGPAPDVWDAFTSKWRTDHGGAPYPFADAAAWTVAGSPTDTEHSPLDVLLSRRPDIQHVPLTCENTNTALPYIDIVNETLEYFVANRAQTPPLKDYVGHDTDGVAPEDLLASPQFVIEAAYAHLRDERFPVPLPFHQPLEKLRRLFGALDIPLALAMERLRKTDELERGGHLYGWRDILMEHLALSREEYEILADAGAVPLWRMYGFEPQTADAAVIADLSNAKSFAGRVGLSVDELIAALRTRFVNPHSDLLPKLERLGVPFGTLQALVDGTITELPLPGGAGAPDPAEFGGDIVAWVKDPDNVARLMSIITLTDPDADAAGCRLDRLELRHAGPPTGPTDTSTRLDAVEFVRLLRLIRLSKKTGWTMAQTDAAICALYRQDLGTLGPDDIDTVAVLDAGFATLLPRLGVVARAVRDLHLKRDRDFSSVLALWSDIGTHGADALYRQMFLNPAVPAHDPAFADSGRAGFLTDPNQRLVAHAEALRTAFNLSADDLERITGALGFDATTALNMANVSAVYRRAWLARKLGLSVRELLLWLSLTGLDPFSLPQATQPALSRLIALLQAMNGRSLKPAAALDLIWHQNLTGTSAPDPVRISELARTLRADFAAIDNEFAASDDGGGDIARARVALVYGQEVSDGFFALLDNTAVVDAPYTHTAAALEDSIAAADPQLAYDPFRHRLSHRGLLSAETRDTLTTLAGVSVEFVAAIDALFARSEDASGTFFTRYPELKPLFDSYVASTAPAETKRRELLAAFRPQLALRRKRQVALQRLSALASVDLDFAQTILDAGGAPYPLHAAGDPGRPALDDVVAVETPGLAAQVFFRDTATGGADLDVSAVASVDYFPNGPNPLPANSAPGAAISAIWHGRIEAPESGYYNLAIEVDQAASATLMFDGQDQPLTAGTVRRNINPLSLQAGRLYEVSLKVEGVKQRVSLKWETPVRAREVIPGRYLYPPAIVGPFAGVYVRFLKAATLASKLALTAAEMSSLSTGVDYQIDQQGWLNALPVDGAPTQPAAAALLTPFEALLDFSRIKAAVSASADRPLKIDGAFFSAPSWNQTAVNDVLAHFGVAAADLSRFEVFRRVYDALTLIRPAGGGAAALIRATTNAPEPALVEELTGALRARFTADDWRRVIQPINDAMRSLQRDALVASVLHQLRGTPATAHIDTPDKLFEYFLMDVQMDACMLTSRIRHALSSVQLFIERALMNLEPRVAAAFVDAAQWTWMKRYRLWEAERKVFLWPENWLEPELRDDKSPFFKEIESELLQSDITEDAATTAMLNYLAKLEEVATLEPCGMHYVEPTATSQEAMHVVARTAGAHRKYYYRRYEFGAWTPWQPIKLDIEDNPIVPVVWKNRLLLFWLRFLERGPETASRPTPGKKLTDLSTDDLNLSDPVVTVQAVLCWSEYYNGKWQTAKASDLNRATTLNVPRWLNRSTLRLEVASEGDALRLSVTPNPYLRIEGPEIIGWPGSFLFYSTHGLPVRGEDTSPPQASVPATRRDVFGDASHDLGFEYQRPGADLQRPKILTVDNSPFQLVEPTHEVADVWHAPMFVGDRRHVFLVTTAERPVLINDHLGYGALSGTAGLQAVAIAGLGDPSPPPRPSPVSSDAFIHESLATTRLVTYGDRRIGRSGSIATTRADT